MKTRVFLSFVFLAAYLSVCFFCPRLLAVWIIGLWAATTTMYLIWSKRRALICAIVILALSAPHSRAFDLLSLPEKQNDKDTMVVPAVCVLVVGGGVCIGLYYLCKSLGLTNAPAAPPPAPVIPTNAPVNPTNKPPVKKTMAGYIAANERVILAQDISGYALKDPNSDTNTTFQFMWTTRLESSTNLLEWRPALTITGYVSPAGELATYYTNGGLSAVTYRAATSPATNQYVDVDIGSESSPRRYWRLARP